MFLERLRYLSKMVLYLGIAGGANEKIGNIFGFAPYWSTSKLGTFVNDASRLPFDAHFLAALVAPVCRQSSHNDFRLSIHLRTEGSCLG